MKSVPTFSSLEEFYFNTPLYAEQRIGYEPANQAFKRANRIDGYCPYCRRESTFIYRPSNMDNVAAVNGEPRFIGATSIHCSRDETHHHITFNVRIAAGLVQKTGQYPSFASIALDQSKHYAKLLGTEYSSEFHKAIGLAAHGVGIGSFVYMRRIFEKLIQNRFDEFKDAEGWSDKEFRDMRMGERIEHLKNHLPDFLVRNTKLYSIMSRGVHELDEETCLAAFGLIKGATIIILEEDKKKKEEMARQAAFEKEIAAFDATTRAPASLSELGKIFFQDGDDVAKK